MVQVYVFRLYISTHQTRENPHKFYKIKLI